MFFERRCRHFLGMYSILKVTKKELRIQPDCSIHLDSDDEGDNEVEGGEPVSDSESV